MKGAWERFDDHSRSHQQGPIHHSNTRLNGRFGQPRKAEPIADMNAVIAKGGASARPASN
jgi:hypothetical protein